MTTNKITFLFSLIFFLSIYEVNAQNEKFEWIKISEGKNDEGITDLATDNNGNIYIVGFSREGAVIGGKSQTCLSAEGYVYFYAKFNALGNLQWFRQFEPRDEKNTFNPEKIDVDKYGNIYLFGVVAGRVNISGIGESHYIQGGEDNVEFLAKYSPNGKVIWANVFEYGFYNNERDFVVDENGNSYLLGYRANVAKIDANGKEIFRKYLPNGFTPGDICLYRDKIFIATSIKGDYAINFTLADGTQINEPKIDAYEGYFYNTELMVACLSRNSGEIIWADLIRSSVGEESKGIGVDSNGNVTVQGVCGGDASFGIDYKQYLPNKRSGNIEIPFITQYTVNGKRRWLKELSIKDKDKDNGSYSVSLNVEPSTGNIYSTRTHCNDNLGWAVYYEKFDKNGRIIDDKVFGFSEEYSENSSFWKSSCGTANFFTHVNSVTGNLYLYGEGTKYSINPVDFGSPSNNKETGGGTNFFICKKTIGSGSTTIEPYTPEPETSTTATNNLVWSGKWLSSWESDYTVATYLTESNGQVSGTYDYENGKIDGKVYNMPGSSMLKGNWSQNNASGWFKFRLNSNKKSFTGEWGYTGETESEGKWNGTKD